MTRIPTNETFDDMADDAEPQTMSLMSGVAGGAAGGGAGGFAGGIPGGGMSEADLLGVDAGKPESKVFNNGTLVLVAVAVVAAASLYAMRITQGDLTSGTGAAEIEAKIENALAKLGKPDALAANDPLKRERIQELFRDTDSIIAMFAADLSAHQVPVEYVKKNPFHLATRPVDEGAPVDTTSRDHARRMEQLRNELNAFNLQTIMVSGNRNVAVISGEFYQPGQVLGSFTITSMDKFTVRLEAAGESFELTLNEKKER